MCVNKLVSFSHLLIQFESCFHITFFSLSFSPHHDCKQLEAIVASIEERQTKQDDMFAKMTVTLNTIIEKLDNLSHNFTQNCRSSEKCIPPNPTLVSNLSQQSSQYNDSGLLPTPLAHPRYDAPRNNYTDYHVRNVKLDAPKFHGRLDSTAKWMSILIGIICLILNMLVWLGLS